MEPPYPDVSITETRDGDDEYLSHDRGTLLRVVAATNCFSSSTTTPSQWESTLLAAVTYSLHLSPKDKHGTMRTVEHFSLQMPDDFPFFENEDVLVRVRHATLYDYRRLPDLKEMFFQCSDHLMGHKFVSLLPGFEDGDGEKALDIGLRYYSGCTVKAPNIDRALYVWEAITDEDHEWASEDVSQSLLARAYSCLAYAYFELHERARKGQAVERDTTLWASYHPLPTARRDDKLANDLLYLSAVYANAAAACGLTSPAVLHTAQWVLRLGERDGVDIKRSARYAPLRDLWCAAEARLRRPGEPEEGVDEVRGQVPDGAQAALLQQGVPEEADRARDRQDWKEHKPLCKPDDKLSSDDAPSGIPKAAVADAPKLAVDERDNIDWDIEMTRSNDGPERAIVIDVPGEGPIRLESRSLTPAVMRWMRGKAAEGKSLFPNPKRNS